MVRLAKCFNSTPHTNERETELHPTCWHQSEVHPHSDEQRRRFPLRAGGFSPFSSLLSLNLTSEITSLRLHPYTAEIVAHDPPMTDLSLSRSTYPFPPIFDHSLFLPLSVWPNCLSLMNDFVLIFVFFKFIYWNFLL